MSWFSLLPEQLSVYEVWIVRFFLFLGLMSIGPWVILLLYDFVLYVWRTLTYEVPILGGRARGKRRPRAPSLKERPSGNPRRFSIGANPSAHGNSAAALMATGNAKQDTNHRHEAIIDED